MTMLPLRFWRCATFAAIWGPSPRSAPPITLATADLADLNERMRQFTAACIEAQIQVVPTDLQHWEGLLTTAPLGHDLLRYLFETDSQTLARLLPSAAAALQGGQGVPILYGVRAEGSEMGQGMGAPVLLDRFAMPSPQWAAERMGTPDQATREPPPPSRIVGPRRVTRIDLKGRS